MCPRCYSYDSVIAARPKGHLSHEGGLSLFATFVAGVKRPLHLPRDPHSSPHVTLVDVWSDHVSAVEVLRLRTTVRCWRNHC